jgi:hypothetical protein
MRSFFACVLATLLVVTTPVGTGQGVHQDDLLHPVLPHLHFVGGHLVPSEGGLRVATSSAEVPRTDAPRQPDARPALGAGAGADATSLGIAISPTLPKSTLVLPSRLLSRLGVSRIVLPSEFLDTPDDPPPQSAA